MDTDSFLIGADGFDITKELNGDYLKKYIDTSNFPKSHAFYSEDNKGVMGLWKSETGSNQIKEVVCLAPKAYSVLMQDGTLKQAAKGVSASARKVLNHSLYVDALMSNTVTKVSNANITSKKMSYIPRNVIKLHYVFWIGIVFGLMKIPALRTVIKSFQNLYQKSNLQE